MRRRTGQEHYRLDPCEIQSLPVSVSLSES
jgi:hypothetical protein